MRVQRVSCLCSGDLCCRRFVSSVLERSSTTDNQQRSRYHACLRSFPASLEAPSRTLERIVLLVGTSSVVVVVFNSSTLPRLAPDVMDSSSSGLAWTLGLDSELLRLPSCYLVSLSERSRPYNFPLRLQTGHQGWRRIRGSRRLLLSLNSANSSLQWVRSLEATHVGLS